MADDDKPRTPASGRAVPVDPPSPGLARRVYFSPATKFFLIGFLTVVLLVPLFIVWGLNSERQARARQAQAEVSQGWGGNQRSPAFL